MKALFIDAAQRQVSEIAVPVESTDQIIELQRRVGGYIESYMLPNGDTLFVDEEGKLAHKKPRHFFSITGTGEVFAGNAVVLGPVDGEGDMTPVRMTLGKLTRLMLWMSYPPPDLPP